MIGGEDLILRFYAFNGKPLSIDTLENYRREVESYVESIGSGPYVPKLRVIQERVVKVLKAWKKNDIQGAEAIEILPIDMPAEKNPVSSGMAGIKRTLGELSKAVKSKPKERTKIVYRESPAQKKKIAVVISEFKKGKLKTSAGKKVTDIKQADAIALREAGVPKKKPKKRSGLKGMGENRSPQTSEVQDAAPVTTPTVTPTADPMPPKSLSGVDYQYYEHDLGEFQPEFHRLNSDANAMFHGQPGHGKTYKFLKLAKHFADQGKKTLYIAKEEFGRSTLKEKLNELGIDDTKPYPNLTIQGGFVESDIEKSDVVFFDSVQALKLTPEKVDALDKKYPNRTFILIVQTTKDGDYKGGKEWEHLVDVAGEVVNRKLILFKNRFDKDNAAKEAELRKEEAIDTATKRIEIQQAVKNRLKPTAPAPAPPPQPQAAA